jgi:hypothetical protein
MSGGYRVLEIHDVCEQEKQGEEPVEEKMSVGRVKAGEARPKDRVSMI